MVPQELGKYTLDQLCGQNLQFLEVLIEFGYPQIGNNITIAIPAVDKDRAVKSRTCPVEVSGWMPLTEIVVSFCSTRN